MIRLLCAAFGVRRLVAGLFPDSAEYVALLSEPWQVSA